MFGMHAASFLCSLRVHLTDRGRARQAKGMRVAGLLLLFAVLSSLFGCADSRQNRDGRGSRARSDDASARQVDGALEVSPDDAGFADRRNFGPDTGPAKPEAGPLAREDDIANCFDSIDNDADNLTDCEDLSCSPLCSEDTAQNCTDGIDNDGDSYVDCGDRDCSELAECLEISCNNGIDDNENGLYDCRDLGCQKSSPYCGDESSETNCGDGIDNDSDGYFDYDDHDCSL